MNECHHGFLEQDILYLFKFVALYPRTLLLVMDRSINNTYTVGTEFIFISPITYVSKPFYFQICNIHL